MDDDLTMQPFYDAAFGGPPLPPLPAEFVSLTANPATTAGRGGVRIEQLKRPGRLGRVTVDRYPQVAALRARQRRPERPPAPAAESAARRRLRCPLAAPLPTSCSAQRPLLCCPLANLPTGCFRCPPSDRCPCFAALDRRQGSVGGAAGCPPPVGRAQ